MHQLSIERIYVCLLFFFFLECGVHSISFTIEIMVLLDLNQNPSVTVDYCEHTHHTYLLGGSVQ